ncbi:unnamed protein product [Caenorhabditis bovis]|uniref:Protein kinase domain-containing protein n=1 Tax=Caenorhabditis bovis TaxID=2654633 RepID=A0A8S1EPZ3_9PELO|nr:unnamed protein product [Caenorhabditis bovis]
MQSLLWCVRSNDPNDRNSDGTTNTEILRWLNNPQRGKRMRRMKAKLDAKRCTCNGYRPGESRCTRHFICGRIYKIRGEKLLLIEAIGKGSYGTVVKFYNETKNIYFAAKMFPVCDFEEFAAEYSKLKVLNSFAHLTNNERIVQLFGYFEIEKHCFISMELLSMPFSVLREKWNQLDVFIIRRLLLQLIEGIIFYSEPPLYLVHGDLKPWNIMIRGTDLENFQLVILDFGLSNRAHTFDRQGIQTLGYRAPEVMFEERYGKAIDMFSFGVLALEMYCGGNVFAANTTHNCITFMERILGRFEYFRNRTNNRILLKMLQDTEYEIPKSLTLSQIFEIYIPENEQKRQAEMKLHDLIKRSLEEIPTRRLTPIEAYKHQFFDSVRSI